MFSSYYKHSLFPYNISIIYVTEKYLQSDHSNKTSKLIQTATIKLFLLKVFFFYKASNQTESLRTAQIHQSSGNYQVPGPKLSQILMENISRSFAWPKFIFLRHHSSETMALFHLKILHPTKQKHTLPLRQTPDKLKSVLEIR